MVNPSRGYLSTRRSLGGRPLACALLHLALTVTACGKGSDGDKAPNPASSPLPLRDGADLNASINFSEPPRAQRYLKARIDLVHQDGSPAQDAKLVGIEPWMTIHGHPSATGRLRFSSAAERPGSFDVEGLYFIMSGPWDLRLKIETGGSQGTSTQIAITLPLNIAP